MDIIAFEDRFERVQKLAWDYYCKAITRDLDGQINYKYFHTYAESLFNKPFDEFEIDEIDTLCSHFERAIEQSMKQERNKKKI